MAYFYTFLSFYLEKKLIKLKILFTIPNFDTAGSGKALLNIAKNLDKNIFEPHICCAHDKGSFFEFVKKSGIPVHFYSSYHNMIPRLKGLFMTFKLAFYFYRLKIDLIHSFHYGPDYSEALASRIAGIPWVYTKKNMNWGGRSKNGWYLRTFLASHVLVQNRDMIIEFFSNSKKMTLVPRSVDTTEFIKINKDKKTLEKHNISKNNKVILCVANLHPAKGVEVLIKAFNICSLIDNNLKLVIAGDCNNQYGKSLIKLSKDSSFSSNIIFTGKVNNILDYYSIAHLFVLPTLKEGRREGSPVSLLEAIACGNSVLGSSVSGIKDILEKFPDSLFESGNIAELSNKINIRFSTIKNKILDGRIRNHIIKNYDIQVETKKHEYIYKKILLKL